MRRRPVRHGWIINARNPIATLGIGAQFERCRAYATAHGIEAREVSENRISGTLAVARLRHGHGVKG